MNTMRGAVGVVLVMVFALGLVMPAWSGITNYTWDASGGAPLDDGSGAWNATGGNNWLNSTNSTYGAWGNTVNDQATFGAGSGAAGTITVGAGGVTANAINFAAPSSGSYTLTGGTITLAGTTPTIALGTNLGATISSVIAGTAGLRITAPTTGNSTSTLTAANTYSGGTTIGSGPTTLVLSGTNASFGSGAITGGNYPTLIGSVGALNGSRTIANGYTMGGGASQFGNGTYNDRLVISGTFTYSANNPSFSVSTANNQYNVLTINAPLGGTPTGTLGFNLQNFISSKTILNGNNSGYMNKVTIGNAGLVVAGQASALGTGSISLSGGTLLYGAGVTTDFSSRFDNTNSTAYNIHTGGNNVTFSIAITPTTLTRSFTKAGDGTLTLNSSTASTFTSGITLRGGTLALDFANMATPTNLLDSNNNVVFAGGTLSLVGKSGGMATTQALGQMTLNNNVDSAIVVNNNSGPGTTLTFTTHSLNVQSTIDFDISQGGTVNNAGLNANTTYRLFTVRDATAIGIARTDGSKNIVRMTNQTTLASNSSSTSTDYITSGSFTMDSALNKAFNSLTLNATAGNGTLNLGAGSFRAGAPGGGAIALIGDNNYTVTNGAIGSTNNQTYVHTLGSGTLTLAVGATFFDGGSTFQVVKNGLGTLQILGAQSNNLGDFVIGQGTVAISNSASLGGTGNVRIAGDSTLRADVAGLTINKSFVFNGDIATDQMRTLTLDVGAGNSLTLGYDISGHGRLIKTGLGTVTLGNTANSYSGGTRLDAGTLSISDSRHLGNRNYNQTVFNGGTLQITGTTLTNLDSNYINWDSFNGGLDIANAANTFTVNSAIGGSGSLTKVGAGKLVLAAANTFTGTLAVSNGTLQVTGSLANSGLSIASGKVLNTGTLDLTGKTLTIDATATAGLLDVTGSLTLGGSLVVLNATTDQMIAKWTGSVSGSFSSAPLPSGFILKVVNGAELWVMKKRGTVIIME